MLFRLRWIAVLVLLLPYVLAGAQGIAQIIRNSPVPETLSLDAVTEDFHAVTLKSSGSDSYMSSVMRLYSRSMPGVSGSAGGDSMELMEMMDVSWTNGRILQTDAGEFLVTYRLAFSNVATTEPQGNPALALRLSLIRKDSIIEISPRPDLTRERLMALISPVAAVQRSASANRTSALSNIKQASLAAMMYMGDYDDVVPFVQDTKSAFAVLMPYSKNASIFKSLNPGSRILLNMAMAGVNGTEVESPAETILFYDEKPWPDGTYLASFMDGHAKFVTASRWADLEKTLRLKLKKVGKPLPPAYWKKIAPNMGENGIS